MEVILRAEAVETAQAGDRCDFTGTLIVVPDVGSMSQAGKNCIIMVVMIEFKCEQFILTSNFLPLWHNFPNIMVFSLEIFCTNFLLICYLLKPFFVLCKFLIFTPCGFNYYSCRVANIYQYSSASLYLSHF